MAVYQVVDDSLSMSLAIQYFGENIEVEEYPYVDLSGPLVLGNKWTYPTSMQVPDPNLPDQVVLTMKSEVVEVGLTVEVPAGVFEGCIRVVEKGHARDEVRLVDGPRAGQGVDVIWEIERYWAPGLGSIRESSRKQTVTLRKPIQVLYDSEFRTDLVEIEEH